MKLSSRQLLTRIAKSTVVQSAIVIAVILFIANLNALADALLHRNIPYFDQEHIVVGAVTAFGCAILFALLVTARRLNKALDTIKTLETILPICSHCKKIRKPDADPRQQDSWQPLESYVTEATDSRFSHGICPECLAKYHGGLKRDHDTGLLTRAQASQPANPSSPPDAAR